MSNRQTKNFRDMCDYETVNLKTDSSWATVAVADADYLWWTLKDDGVWERTPDTMYLEDIKQPAGKKPTSICNVHTVIYGEISYRCFRPTKVIYWISTGKTQFENWKSYEIRHIDRLKTNSKKLLTLAKNTLSTHLRTPTVWYNKLVNKDNNRA